MTFKHIAAVAVGIGLLMACEDGGKPPTAQETADTAVDPGTPTPQGAPFIEYVDQTCVGTQINMLAHTLNFAYGGEFYIFDTSYAPAYDEDGSLVHVQNDPNGAWDEWGIQLTTGATPNNWQPGVTSVFVCPNWDALTKVIEVYDVDGNVADCVVFGHNPTEIINGTWPDGGEENTNGTVIGNRFANCAPL